MKAIPKHRATARQIAEAVRICGTGGYEAGDSILVLGNKVVGMRTVIRPPKNKLKNRMTDP